MMFKNMGLDLKYMNGESLDEYEWSSYSMSIELNEEKILNLLVSNPRTLDNLINVINLNSDELINNVMILEVKGKLYKKGIYYYIA